MNNEAIAKKNYKFINTFTLKLMAILFMTIDHVAVVIGTRPASSGHLYYSNLLSPHIYDIMRHVGRLAFPIYCYLIVEGFFFTRNVKKYVLRLSIFAFISQIPFSLAVMKEPFYMGDLNTLFTLAIGLTCVALFDAGTRQLQHCSQDTDRFHAIPLQFSFIIIIALSVLSVLLKTDYSIYGILLIFIFYIFRGQPVKIFAAMTLDCILLQPATQLYSLFALIPIFLYNGKKGPSIKYIFYIYYPLHLTLLYFIYMGMSH